MALQKTTENMNMPSAPSLSMLDDLVFSRLHSRHPKPTAFLLLRAERQKQKSERTRKMNPIYSTICHHNGCGHGTFASPRLPDASDIEETSHAGDNNSCNIVKTEKRLATILISVECRLVIPNACFFI